MRCAWSSEQRNVFSSPLTQNQWKVEAKVTKSSTCKNSNHLWIQQKQQNGSVNWHVSWLEPSAQSISKKKSIWITSLNTPLNRFQKCYNYGFRHNMYQSTIFRQQHKETTTRIHTLYNRSWKYRYAHAAFVFHKFIKNSTVRCHQNWNFWPTILYFELRFYPRTTNFIRVLILFIDIFNYTYIEVMRWNTYIISVYTNEGGRNEICIMCQLIAFDS